MKDNWIVATRQSWKFVVGCFMLIISSILFKIGFHYLDKSDNVFIVLVLGGVLSTSISIIWLIVSMRCQFCGGKIVWKVMKTHNAFSWFTDLITLDNCPLCHKRLTDDATGKPLNKKKA